MNREQRRALKKAERNTPIMQVPELTDKAKQWVGYMEQWGIDMNKWFIAFSGWLSLTQNEKSAVVMDLVGKGLVTPDKDSKKSTETGWKKVDSEGKIIEDAEVESSEDSTGESVSDTVSVSGD